MREQQRPASQARRSEGGLGTSVAAANHDDIELLRELHRERQFYATVPRGTSVILRRFVSRGTCRFIALQHQPGVGQSRAFTRGYVISLARYAALLQEREMRRTIVASIIGRLPIGITGLAVLLLVQTATHSF